MIRRGLKCLFCLLILGSFLGNATANPLPISFLPVLFSYSAWNDSDEGASQNFIWWRKTNLISESDGPAVWEMGANIGASAPNLSVTLLKKNGQVFRFRLMFDPKSEFTLNGEKLSGVDPIPLQFEIEASFQDQTAAELKLIKAIDQPFDEKYFPGVFDNLTAYSLSLNVISASPTQLGKLFTPAPQDQYQINVKYHLIGKTESAGVQSLQIGAEIGLAADKIKDANALQRPSVSGGAQINVDKDDKGLVKFILQENLQISPPLNSGSANRNAMVKSVLQIVRVGSK